MGEFNAPSACRSDEVDTSARDDLLNRIVARARTSGVGLGGHHNLNHVVGVSPEEARFLRVPTDSRVMVRHRRDDVLPVVIRTWRDEHEILGAIGGSLPNVPQCLARSEGVAIHSYMVGVPLAVVCHNGKPVESLLIEALAGQLAEMARVPVDGLPVLPARWPRDGDSRGFLRVLAHQADAQILKPNWAEFGALFASLGVRRTALTDYAGSSPPLRSRPFGLLHGDLHRDNVIVTFDGTPPLMCVDWELATYGDPLHDLAVHLVRMHYPAEQRCEVVARWREAMTRVRSEATAGLGEDLRHYVDFEYAQSVFPDVIRAVSRLGETFTQSDLEASAYDVHRALSLAAEPLRLGRVPEVDAIEPLLQRWKAATARG
ncbi:phosphotransferase [Streptomyces sp. SID8379]|uniref:aminoglycoside phosphotransferase family protein n=1 Tax=unclassified Streptomyces TaxID=2593676 RepID=UPI00036B2147|nr:aminoglycoside phosphotransferase family protein [Streptomyces sp. HmicA12]MYW67855.1 phosphotransferase [Streptomyces sp. SID8379]